MSLVLNTNLNSLTAQNSLATSGAQLSAALSQLSSGLRINTAADDAAGYAIVQGLTSQIGGLNQAARNAADGVSLTQTGGGALQEITTDLQTMRNLAVQSLNATNSAQDRANLDQQFQQLSADISNVAKTANFNGVNLLDGSFNGQSFQTGPNAGNTIQVTAVASADTIDIGQYASVSQTGIAVTATAPNGPLSVQIGSAPAINLASTVAADADKIAAAINGGGISGLTATSLYTSAGVTATKTGAAGNVDTITVNNRGIAVNVGATAAASLGNAVAAINAANVGVTASATGGKLVLTSAGDFTATFTAGANTTASNAADYGLADTTTTDPVGTLGFSYSGAPATAGQTITLTGPGLLNTSAAAVLTGSVAASNVQTVASSNAALFSIDSALQTIASTGAQFGAFQNRFQAAIGGLNTTSTNLSAARSAIQDTNYAQATSELAKAQILQQASTAMVAQANMIPQNVLSLLQKLP